MRGCKAIACRPVILRDGYGADLMAVSGRPPGLPAGCHQAGSAAVTEGDNSQSAMAVRWAQIAEYSRLAHGLAQAASECRWSRSCASLRNAEAPQQIPPASASAISRRFSLVAAT